MIDFIDDNIKALFTRALERRRLAHAFLFCGEAKSGREQSAFALAAALLCESDEQVLACAQCGSCRRVIARTHPDIVHVMSELELAERGLSEGKASARAIKIDAIREASRRLQMASYEGRGRVAIFVGAQNMNTNAQNALLKTLEEPPANTHLILIAPHPRAIVSTIASRSQIVRFSPVAPEDVEPDSNLYEWLDALDANDSPRMMDLIESAGKDRALVRQHLSALRAALMSRTLENISPIEGARAGRLWAEKLGLALSALDRNANVQLTLEKTFLTGP